MSLAEVERPIPAIPEQRGRESPEVIDVDLFDAEEVARIGSRPPTQRRRVSESGRSVPVDPEVIIINDSDDDDIQFVRARPAPRSRTIFSPSPPPQIAAIPPVPPIPRRFIPMRRRPPPFPTAPGLVIPNAEPFPFETNIRVTPAPIERPPAPVPAAAPSHHIPVMGFGGALLQRARAAFEQPPARSHNHERRRRVFGIPADVFMQWNPLDFFGPEEDELYDDDGFRHYRAADFHDEPGDRLMRGDLRLFNAHVPGRPSEPDYKPEYTHPVKPPSGFTYDFESSSMTPASIVDIDGPGSSSSSSSRSGETMLTCPRCHDPLMLGAADVAEDRAKRRLWGLRCGHLLDGKCVEELMKPIPLVSPDPVDTADVQGKGKGKAREEDELELPGAYLNCSVKSRGKETDPNIFNIFGEPEFSSIRSRLRPRPPLPSHPSGPLPAGPGPSHGRARAAPRLPVKAKANGKGRAKVPSVEAEYEWTCPVGGCGCVHVSQLIDGQWIMDEKKGAITVFV
ncbi:uncharacterized protein EDB93DRAFT_1151560 [Suillus bovinus]|uniref:uncharacterized protein n=1 Tax=Suillus bovinus TaxID=48563 RepID=UPI001B86D154|nr:uncharacterized protein EDB93DRAFT_1151560 [Suillus bovinus]KAG2145314.1 hypothetical protein EDB93DRAFT_1151560 [Suillus bovinus]